MNSLQISFLFTLIAAVSLGPSDSCAAVTPLFVVQQENQPNETELTQSQLAAVKNLEQKRIVAINKVIGSVVAIYDDDRQGGGSGVIIDPSGIALTNHHVIVGSGVTGWGGLADGKLYRWKLIGTDPGGDVAIIQMEGDHDFPFTPLGDSDEVHVGDWALAMGNPFILTEDQAPTVTLGIVSGVKRYQPGAGKNQLVYGNCIQVDSSINPGNSGGPLFNLEGRVIGINGRGSFKERGRVNVGLGYAISANQIKNFIPDLLATKLTEHATLDLQFSDRSGKVVCSRIDVLAPIAKEGLELGDELIEFEGIPIKTANQFTNLICTLPEQWPTELKVRKSDGEIKTYRTRAFGLPYKSPRAPRPQPNPTPEEKKKIRRQLAMLKMLAAKPGTIRDQKANRKYANQVVAAAKNILLKRRQGVDAQLGWVVAGTIGIADQQDDFELKLGSTGGFRLMISGQLKMDVIFDGQAYYKQGPQQFDPIATQDLIQQPQALFAIGMASVMAEQPFSNLPNALIDGSGKAQNNNAWRMVFQTPDETPLYGWFKMYGKAGLPEPRLVKLASDRDASKGGVVFDRWEQKQNRWMPMQATVVSGLAETTVLRIQVDTVELAQEKDVDFSMPTEPEAKQ